MLVHQRVVEGTVPLAKLIETQVWVKIYNLSRGDWGKMLPENLGLSHQNMRNNVVSYRVMKGPKGVPNDLTHIHSSPTQRIWLPWPSICRIFAHYLGRAQNDQLQLDDGWPESVEEHVTLL